MVGLGGAGTRGDAGDAGSTRNAPFGSDAKRCAAQGTEKSIGHENLPVLDEL